MRRPIEKAMEVDSDEEPDEEAADTKLQEVFLSLKKKIDLVKKSVPEGSRAECLTMLMIWDMGLIFIGFSQVCRRTKTYAMCGLLPSWKGVSRRARQGGMSCRGWSAIRTNR